MLYDIIDALEHPNGISKDIWIHILNMLGDDDPTIKSASCFGNRYYISDMHRNRLRHMIPRIEANDDVSDIVGPKRQLALPPHVIEEHPDNIRCNKCKGPFHPATGHAFSAIMVACGPCYGRFAAWQMKKYGWRPITTKQVRRIDKKRAESIQRAKKAAKAAEKQAAKEVVEREMIYGIPRQAQAAQNPILER